MILHDIKNLTDSLSQNYSCSQLYSVLTFIFIKNILTIARLAVLSVHLAYVWEKSVEIQVSLISIRCMFACQFEIRSAAAVCVTRVAVSAPASVGTSLHCSPPHLQSTVYSLPCPPVSLTCCSGQVLMRTWWSFERFSPSAFMDFTFISILYRMNEFWIYFLRLFCIYVTLFTQKNNLLLFWREPLN